MKEWFCLKGKEHFHIDPQLDAEVYFARQPKQEEILKRVENGFSSIAGVPKMFLTGFYGGGKTHTLFHIKHYLEKHVQNLAKCEVVYFDIGMIRKNTTYVHLHQRFLESLGFEKVKNLIELFVKNQVGENLEERMGEYFPNSNIAKAVRNLAYVSSSLGLVSWRWLCGEKLKDEDLGNLLLTKNLTEPDELTDVLLSIGKFYKEIRKKKLVYLIDEAEALHSIRDVDAQGTFHWGFRDLASDRNNSIGFVIAYSVIGEGGTETIPHFIAEPPDIISRIGERNIIDIGILPRVSDVREFIHGMLDYIVDKEKAKEKIENERLDCELQNYPLKTNGLEMICKIMNERPEIRLPRNIIKALNDCAIEAKRNRQKVIDANIVQQAIYPS